MLKISIFALLIFCLISSLFQNITGQLQKPGRFRNQIYLKSSNSIKEYEMPLQDNTKLLAETLAEEDEDSSFFHHTRKESPDQDGIVDISFTGTPPKARPYTFGTSQPLLLNMTDSTDGEWIINEEMKTRMWRFKVSSKGALSLSIYFSDFHLSYGSELYIIGQDQTLGAFTAENNNNPERTFGVIPVSGEFLILEYIEPIRPKDHPLNSFGHQTSIVVSHVVHAFRSNPFSKSAAQAEVGTCHINVACPEGNGKNDMINSVALLINGKGRSICTGTMINNAGKDGRQLFLTADHCLSKGGVENYLVGFQYQKRYCNSALEPKPEIKSVHGMRVLGRAVESDYAILEVVESIPNDWDVFLAGFDAGVPPKSGNYFGIHHPDGSPKKISTYSGKLDVVRLKMISSQPNFLRVHKWTKGATEYGSSGSPLFDSHGYVIGQLFGGESSCDRLYGSDYYGALDKSWSASTPLSEILDPKSQGNTKIKGAYLRDLRIVEGDSVDLTEPVNPPEIKPEDGAGTVTKTETETVTVSITSTETETIAKTTIHVTSTVYRNKKETVTVTETFNRVPPPKTVTKTVTVSKKNQA